MAGRYTKDVGVESLRKFKIGGTSSVRGLNICIMCAPNSIQHAIARTKSHSSSFQMVMPLVVIPSLLPNLF